MERKGFGIKFKELKESGEFLGFASIYGKPDLVGDIVEKGSFTKAIQEQGEGLPLLWSHDPSQPVGLMKIEDDSKGLLGHGKLDLDDAAGKAAHNRVMKGYVKGLSIGFVIPSADSVRYDAEGVRHLHQIRLLEISLTAVPAMPDAQILAAKSLREVPRLLDGIEPGVLAAGELKALGDIKRHLDRLLAGHRTEDAILLRDLNDIARMLRA